MCQVTLTDFRLTNHSGDSADTPLFPRDSRANDRYPSKAIFASRHARALTVIKSSFPFKPESLKIHKSPDTLHAIGPRDSASISHWNGIAGNVFYRREIMYLFLSGETNKEEKKNEWKTFLHLQIWKRYIYLKILINKIRINITLSEREKGKERYLRYDPAKNGGIARCIYCVIVAMKFRICVIARIDARAKYTRRVQILERR